MDVASMEGKTVVVTGGNSGIGRETAVALARAGARTLITARNAERGAGAVDDIRGRSRSTQVEQVVFDLSSLGSVRSGAHEILDRTDRIDVLVNNAGIVLSKRQETVDGFEATFATNHLGPFLLTTLLLDRLKASAPSRVVTVASTAHRSVRGGLDFSDLQSTKGYRGLEVYAASKLANILFTIELSRRLEGSGVTANCLHPGVVATGYAQDGDTSGFLPIGMAVIRPFLLTAEKGARTSVYLASSPEVAGVSGLYFAKCKPAKPTAAASDLEAARQLWDISEELVGARGTPGEG